jgi:hypothetical protein
MDFFTILVAAVAAVAAPLAICGRNMHGTATDNVRYAAKRGVDSAARRPYHSRFVLCD